MTGDSHIQSRAVLQVATFAQPGPAARWSDCSHHDSCICCSLSLLKTTASADCWMATRLPHEIVRISHNRKAVMQLRSTHAVLSQMLTCMTQARDCQLLDVPV